MLINCAAYQDGKKLGDIRKEEIHEYLSRPALLWVAIKDGPRRAEGDAARIPLHEPPWRTRPTAISARSSKSTAIALRSGAHGWRPRGRSCASGR